MHYLKLFEIKKTLIKYNCKISDAIKSLNNSRLKIVLVLTKNNKLAGTVVDGDVRRGLLKGINLKDPVIKIMNKNLLTVDLNTKKKEAIYSRKKTNLWCFELIYGVLSYFHFLPNLFVHNFFNIAN